MNSFQTLKETFSNECHDEKGEFCTGVSDAVSNYTQGLSATNQKAIADYTLTGYTEINKQLRNGNLSPQAATTVKRLDAVIKGAPTLNGETVYRGVGTNVYGPLHPGQEITEPGFLSTSSDKGSADLFNKQGGMLMSIKTAQDTKAVAGRSLENELLLPRNTTLKITSVENTPPKGTEKLGHAIVHAEIIPKATLKASANSFTLLDFYNQNHDEKGRFAPAESEGTGTENKDLANWKAEYDKGGVSKEDYEAGIKEIKEEADTAAHLTHYGFLKEMPSQLGGVLWAFEGQSPLITSAAGDILHGNAFDYNDQYRDYSKDQYDAAHTILSTLENTTTDQPTYSGHHRQQEDIDAQLKEGKVFFPLVAASPELGLAEAYGYTRSPNTKTVIYEFPKGSQGAFYHQNEYIQSGEYRITGHTTTGNTTHISLEQTAKSYIPPLELPDEEGEGGTYREEPALRASALKPIKKTKTAGLAIVAGDTGRVLMLQRQNSNKKDGGKWEFPGGHVEQDEAHHEAAIREWTEETGIRFPENGEWNDLHWLSPDKKYMGLIYRIPHESDIKINPAKTRRLHNPDDPKKENIETVAWFSPADLKDNPAVREECHATPWHILAASTSNSFTLLEFYNENHDAQGRFTEDGNEGSVPATGIVNYSALTPQKFSKSLRDDTLVALNNPKLASVIQEWQHGSDNLVRHNPTLIDAIHNAPTTPQILYRGIVDTSGGVKAIMNKYKDGSEINLPASSFSSSYGVGKVFTLGGETEPSKGISVVFGVLAGSKALPIQNFASTSSFHSEKEFITGGKFRVIGADRNPDIPGGVLVTLKQLETL